MSDPMVDNLLDDGMMANITYCFIALLVLFLISVFYLFVQSGLFSSIIIDTRRPPFGGLHIAYKFARGAYKNAGHLFTEAHTLIPELKTIGVYYDDPQQVNTADLRYCVGVVLSDGEKPTNEEHLKAYLDRGFKEIRFPAVDHAVLTTFPFSNTLSIFIGVARVYPKIAAYIQENKLCAHPMIEIYDKDSILFMTPLSRQDEFYVEETEEEEDERVNSTLEESEKEGSVSDAEQRPAALEDDIIEQPAEINGPVDDTEDSSASSFEELQH